MLQKTLNIKLYSNLQHLLYTLIVPRLPIIINNQTYSITRRVLLSSFHCSCAIHYCNLSSSNCTSYVHCAVKIDLKYITRNASVAEKLIVSLIIRLYNLIYIFRYSLIAMHTRKPSWRKGYARQQCVYTAILDFWNSKVAPSPLLRRRPRKPHPKTK